MYKNQFLFEISVKNKVIRSKIQFDFITFICYNVIYDTVTMDSCTYIK